jgi:hypothetical protein
MTSPHLMLKHDTAWFAAGIEVEKAMQILSDGAFKLYLFLCLEARRDQGRIEISQTELAKRLNKGTQTIRHHLRELEQSAICRLSGFAPVPYSRGQIEITDDYWPYHRSPVVPPDPAAHEFIARIRCLLEARACVRLSFSTADEILARQWQAKGLALEQIHQAIILGCARKYVAWRNHQSQTPIASLRYFEPLLEEIQQSAISPDYFEYVQSRLDRIEKLWIQSHRPKQAPHRERIQP